MKRLLFLFVLLWATPLWGQALTQTPNLGLYIIPFNYPNYHIPINDNTVTLDTAIGALQTSVADGTVTVAPIRVTVATKPANTVLNQMVVVTDASDGTTCTVAGGMSNNTCQWDGSNWVVVGGGGTSGGPLDQDLIDLANNSTAGFWAAATNAARTFANGTGIAWTNPAGIAGNPQANVTSTVVMTDRSSTWTTGDVDLRLASSFRFPNATGAAPTTPSTMAFDLTSQTYRAGLTNGTTVTFATTGLLSAYQPLHANLTGISSLSGGSGARIPYIDGAGNWGFFTKVLCINSGVNVIHTSSISPLTETCDASASGLSGATNNYGLFATGATTFTSSEALQLDGSGNVWAKNGLVVGDVSTNSLSINAAAVTGAKTWTALNFNGTVRVSTGAFTPGNVVTTDANGLLIDGGAAGSGDVTLTGAQELEDKTLDEANGNIFKITKSVQVELFSSTTDNAAAAMSTTGTGLYYFIVPVSLNGTVLTGVQARVAQPGTTGTVQIQIYRCADVATGALCSGTTAAMLTSVASIDSGESSTATAASLSSVNTSNDDVATGQVLQFVVPVVHTTPAKGLFVNLDFKLP